MRHDESDALLELLDGWPFSKTGTESYWAEPGGGREFFRRYVEHDPAFSPENVWVIEEGGRLVSCVQIFPRTLRASSFPTLGVEEAATVDCGGIGSVFTLPECRGRGHAGALLAAGVQGMSDRGMEISLLVAARVAWYESLGWAPWCNLETRLEPPAPTPPAGCRQPSPGDEVEIRRLEEDDLEGVRRLGDLYSVARLGSVRRDAAGWRASLKLSGNPEEDFWLAGRTGRVLAYVRATDLYGERQILEWGYEPGRVAEQVTLFGRALGSSPSAITSGLQDPTLEAQLKQSGWKLELQQGSSWMLRALAPQRLAARFGLPASDPATVLLERIFPRDRFTFWMADRF